MRIGGRRSVPAPALGILFLSSACNELSEVSLGDGPQTPNPCADASDVRCSAFGPPVLVAGLGSPADDDKPTLPATMLEMYFYSKRDGGPGQGDVWRTARPTLADPWSPPALVPAVSSPSRETSPAVSSDGTTLWVASDRAGGPGGLDIWVSTRASGADWSPPVLVTELSSPGDDLPRPPGLTSLVMPLSYRAAMANPYQTYMAVRASASPSATWSAPVAWASIDTANLDDDAFLTDDGLTMYFSSDRGGGGQDLFVAERLTPSADFGAAVPLTTLNTAGSNERDPWVSPDGHTIYFASDRTGTLKIYSSTR